MSQYPTTGPRRVLATLKDGEITTHFDNPLHAVVVDDSDSLSAIRHIHISTPDTRGVDPTEDSWVIDSLLNRWLSFYDIKHLFVGGDVDYVDAELTTVMYEDIDEVLSNFALFELGLEHQPDLLRYYDGLFLVLRKEQVGEDPMQYLQHHLPPMPELRYLLVAVI